MIIDRIEYVDQYFQLLPHLADALQLIAQQPNMEPGKHFFYGGFVMRQTGCTRPVYEGTYEAHRKYVDVQILMNGRELILWDRLENMQEIEPYQPETDKCVLQGHESMVEMRPGMFCVLFPSDAHAACRHEESHSGTTYEKYVVKLEL